MRKKSAREKTVRGNPGKRPLPNSVEITRPDKAPACPFQLSEAQIPLWDHFSTLLHERGLLSDGDTADLWLLVKAISELNRLEEILEVEGSILTRVSPKGELTMRSHPAVTQRNAQVTLVNRLLKDFGLSPDSRTKVETLPIKKAENPFARFKKDFD